MQATTKEPKEMGSDLSGGKNLKVNNSSCNSQTNSPLSHKRLMDKGGCTNQAMQCLCNEIKTQLKITVTGNLEDLAITCNGVKTAESIADLVDGYCRMFNNTDTSFWDRSCMHLFILIFYSIPINYFH